MDKTIISKGIQASSHNWFKNIDPFDYAISEEMTWDVIDFINAIERAKIILVGRDKDEILAAISIMHRLSHLLKMAYIRKNKPTKDDSVIFSDVQAMLECRKEVEITPVKGMVSKPTWAELLAAFSLKQAIEGIQYWEDKDTFKKYAKDLAVSSVSAITAAELLNEPIKAGKKGGIQRKSLDHYNTINDKLCLIYWDKYSKLSNRKAATKLLNDLSEKEKNTFATIEPEITIQKWIAEWKKNKNTQA
jgi:Glu-tRNA(Gln) amidotransferase subunit E-like FAD-binding protein